MIGHKHWLSCNDIVAYNVPRKPITRNINHMTIRPPRNTNIIIKVGYKQLRSVTQHTVYGIQVWIPLEHSISWLFRF